MERTCAAEFWEVFCESSSAEGLRPRGASETVIE